MSYYYGDCLFEHPSISRHSLKNKKQKQKKRLFFFHFNFRDRHIVFFLIWCVNNISFLYSFWSSICLEGPLPKYILEVEPTEFSDGGNVECEIKKKKAGWEAKNIKVFWVM